ncbi:hypothetical protein C3E96_000085 [Klebsiella pneumoniae]|nr:hypothetical protein C3E96_000085 [Klebsiella pneumoniae]
MRQCAYLFLWYLAPAKACCSRWTLSTSASARFICSVFDTAALTAWQELAAEVTFYFRWTEDRAWGMTYSRLKWWVSQASRINKIRKSSRDE